MKTNRHLYVPNGCVILSKLCTLVQLLYCACAPNRLKNLLTTMSEVSQCVSTDLCYISGLYTVLKVCLFAGVASVSRGSAAL